MKKQDLEDFWKELKHFSPHEFDSPGSPGSGKENMDRSFLLKLNFARSIAEENFPGLKFVIISGYRTKERNEAVGGVYNSSHTNGTAVDIAAINSKQRYQIMYCLMEAGFVRFGINFDGKTIHVDDDKRKPQEVIWGY